MARLRDIRRWRNPIVSSVPMTVSVNNLGDEFTLRFGGSQYDMQFNVGEAEVLRDRLTELLDGLKVNAKI